MALVNVVKSIGGDCADMIAVNLHIIDPISVVWRDGICSAAAAVYRAVSLNLK